MRFSFFLIFALINLHVFGQSRSTTDWVDFGGDHTSKWLQIAPAKLGPNALPVPFMDYGTVDSLSNFESGVHAHFMKGDKAVNSYLSFYWTLLPKKIAVHIWSFPTETFRTDNSVRTDRQIFLDDTGWINQAGDLWISTYIQVLSEKKNRPGISINYTAKTTTGGAIHGRYTDSPANYYYVAFGKSFFPKYGIIDKVGVGFMGGFYVWQTNKVELAQDEGILYEIGLELNHRNITWRNEFGGFNGYDAYKFIGVKGNNDPFIYRTNFSVNGEHFNWKWEYQTGFRDYSYTTLRMTVFYKFKLEM